MDELLNDGAELEVPEHLEGWLEAALREVQEVMLERGQKYGPGNIAQFGELGVLVRLSDKLARLRHTSGKDFADEAARDAWMDVVGYGLIGLGWVDGNWPGSSKPKPKPEEPVMVVPELVAERRSGHANDDCCISCGEYRSMHKPANHPFISEEE